MDLGDHETPYHGSVPVLRFSCWAALSAAFTIGITSEIGIFVLPVVVLIGGIAFRWLWRPDHRRELLGLVAGPALVAIVLGALNVGSHPCGGGSISLPSPGPGGTLSTSCGGFDGKPWLIAGLALLALTVVLIAWRGPRFGSRRKQGCAAL